MSVNCDGNLKWFWFSHIILLLVCLPCCGLLYFAPVPRWMSDCHLLLTGWWSRVYCWWQVDDLLEASKSIKTLPTLIELDLERNCVRKAGSHSRNLLRVKRGLDMVRVLFEQILVTEYVNWLLAPLNFVNTPISMLLELLHFHLESNWRGRDEVTSKFRKGTRDIDSFRNSCSIFGYIV